MQKLVKAIVCLGLVSVSLIACESDNVDENVIQLDQLDQIDDQVFNEDSTTIDSIITNEEDMVKMDEEVEGENDEE